jgi:hypothetical protein
MTDEAHESPKAVATKEEAKPESSAPKPASSAGPPPPPPLFDSFWPEPDRSRAPVALLAALIGGAGAAIFLPFGSPGIGWPLMGLMVAIGLFLVGRRAERKVHFDRIMWAVAALLLLSVCALRAAEWLAALCVLTAIAATMLAVSGGRTVRDFMMAAFAVPIAAFRALPWTARGTRELRRATGGVRIAVSVLVSILLLMIFGGLFAGADERFADLVKAITPDLDDETLARWTILFGMFAFATLGAAFTMVKPPVLTKRAASGKTLRPLEWALPVGVLVVLFATYIGVQATPLFAGADEVRNTERLTFAGSARSGFWQLTMVTILTLPVIGAAARWAPKETRTDRALLRGLAGGLAVLTLVIVVSALTRMWAYQNAYGFTVMRLLVESCELWLGLVYLMVIAAGVRLRADWLPTAIVATAMGALLALAAINPEGVVVERNVARFQETGKLDTYYLEGLSPDAVSALDELPAGPRDQIVAEIGAELSEEDWRSWNLTRHLAFGRN